MRIRVKTLMRRTFGLDVHPSASIDEVKAILTQVTTPLPCPKGLLSHNPSLRGVLARPTILGHILPVRPCSLAPGTPDHQPRLFPLVSCNLGCSRWDLTVTNGCRDEPQDLFAHWPEP